MKVIDTPLEGLKLVEPRVFDDERGFFMETYNAGQFSVAGLPVEFAQDNHSHSGAGVLRGLHYQYPTWQGKLVRVVQGKVFDVAVDIRLGSPTFGRWFGTNLTAENKRQLYIPDGFAHGFCVLSNAADVVYKCTTLYVPEEDCCIRWDDPHIGIKWPIDNPRVSDKDSNGSMLNDVWD